MIRDERASGFGSALVLVAVVSLIVLTALLFFGDIGRSSEQTEMPDPEMSFNHTTAEDGDDRLRIRHVEGARINPMQLFISLSDATCTGSGEPNGRYSASEDFGLTKSNWVSPGMVLIVDSDNPVRMCEEGTLELDGASVELVWESPDGETETIDRWSR
jgi:hypothetical protein